MQLNNVKIENDQNQPISNVEIAVNLKYYNFFKQKNPNKYTKNKYVIREVIQQKFSQNWIQNQFLLDKINITIKGKTI